MRPVCSWVRTNWTQLASGEGAHFRLERLRLAILTSVGSKAATLGIQFLALPVAVRALGQERFALYAVVSAGVGWLTVANLGLGPGLTVTVASAAATSDLERQKRALGSAAILVLAFGSGLALVAAGVVWWVGPARLLGEVADGAAEAGIALQFLIGLGLVQAVLSVPEAVQRGLHDQHVLNLWQTVGNIGSVIAVLVAASWHPSVISMIVAMNAPVVLARVANSIGFGLSHRRLLRGFPVVSRVESGRLLSTGMAYTVVSVGAFINHQLPVVLAGRGFGASSTANLAASMSAFLLAFGTISLIGAPLWPAIADAASRRELGWLRDIVWTVRGIALAVGLAVGVGIATLGSWALRLWCGSAVAPSATLMVVLGCYFVLSSWEYVHYMFLLGLDSGWPPSLFYAARSALGLVGCYFVLGLRNEAWLVLVLAVSVSAVTAWAFPVMVQRTLSHDLRHGLASRGVVPRLDD